MNRRQVLGSLTAGGLLAAGGWWGWWRGGPRVISCVRRGDGGHAVVAVGLDGGLRWEYPLPGRGHDVELSPDGGTVAVFARRPGRRVWLLNVASGALQRELQAPDGHQFNGHGVFGPDGRHLFITETAFAPGSARPRGVIGLYARDSGARLGAWDSGGLDPHQCAWCGDALVVAHGGYIESPDPDVAKVLDPDRPPNLAWLDAADGRLRRRDHLDDPALSIRHLDVAGDAALVGFQHDAGPLAGAAPLLGRATPDRPLRPLAGPDMGWDVFHGYIGSVAVAGEHIVATSPRGGAVGVWRRDGAFERAVPEADVCGAGHDGGRWIASSGHGRLLVDGRAVARLDYAFDNHLAVA